MDTLWTRGIAIEHGVSRPDSGVVIHSQLLAMTWSRCTEYVGKITVDSLVLSSVNNSPVWGTTTSSTPYTPYGGKRCQRGTPPASHYHIIVWKKGICAWLYSSDQIHNTRQKD